MSHLQKTTEGHGNPNGVLTAGYATEYLDLDSSIYYKQATQPYGNSWWAIRDHSALDNLTVHTHPQYDDVTRVPFTFATTSPMIALAVPAGQWIAQCRVWITTVFNDPTATLRVGSFADTSLILPVTFINPLVLGQYATDEIFLYSVADYVIVTLSPGASTQGAGQVWIYLRSQ